MKIRRPSHATVVAYLALLVALGGSAYAVTKVGTNDLKNNAVTGKKIRNGTVGAADLKNFHVRTRAANIDAATGFGRVLLSCGKRERLISGAGGWETEGTVTNTDVGGNAILVRGAHPGGGTLFARAICLRK
jgi:hypothetical protein